MAGKVSREELMQEINKLDVEINSLIGQMPPPVGLDPVPFPALLWIVGLAGIGVYAATESGFDYGYLASIKDYAIWILVVGCAFALLALVTTMRWVGSKMSVGGGQHYRATSETIANLKKKRSVLEDQLRRTPE